MYGEFYDINYGITPTNNGFGNQAIGVYTPYNQFDIDETRLVSLGFTYPEIQTLRFIIASGGKATIHALTMYGLEYETAGRIKYMYDIVTGRVNIDGTDDLVKHLRKLFGKHQRIGIHNLALSRIQSVPRYAVIGGIKDETFSIYNSAQYPVEKRMYNVVDISNGRIFVETDRKPVLKYKQPKKIEGVIEIIELKKDGKVVVAVDKKYSRLCNRFVIIGSLKRPEFHLGMIEIICIEGTKVYIYGHCMGTRDTVRYNGGTQRVYEYGCFPNEIQPKLLKVAAEMYPILSGVYAVEHPANSDFRILPVEEKEERIEDTIEDMIED